MSINRVKIANSVYFSGITDERYKTNRISINLIMPLDKETASANAIVPSILTRGNESYPDFMKLTKKLHGLYGAVLSNTVGKLGDAQVCTVSISGIDDAYALSGEKLTEEMASILIECLLNPVLEDGLFKDKNFNLEKNNLIDQIDAEINDKRTYSINRASAIMCEDEPYGINRYGSKESAEKLTNSMAYDAYKRMLNESRIEIIFVGCGDYNNAKTVFEKAFSALDRSDSPMPETVLSAPKSEPLTHTDRLQVNQSKMVLGFKTDCDDVSAMRLMTALYGGTPTSKLFMNVRERLSLCYYCVARYDRIKGLVLVDCGVESDNIEKAKDEILAQLENVKQGDFTDSDIENDKLSLLNSFKTIGDAASAVEGWYVTQIYSGTNFTPEEEGEKLSNIGKDEIVQAAQSLKLDTIYVLTGEESQQEGE
ncbi:MAG: insulinase family protein [Clostridiales bacterium]|nr:insulinase family protein [Clostridiales bacterium]